jgi:hypothetical protein
VVVRHVASAPHEWVGHYLYDAHGLDPFFAADSQVKDGGGSKRGQFSLDGERWVVKLYYQESGLKHPGDTLPSGRVFALDQLREYRLAIRRHPEEDPVGEQKANAHLSPRWQGMESKGSGSDPSVPEEIEEAVNVRISGSNVEFERYLPMLRKAAEAVGIAGYYFRPRKLHPYSNVQDAARYVRLEKDASGPVHARDGPLVGMAHLLEHDRTGYRKLVQNDTDEVGEDLPGYYHTVTLDPTHTREAFPHHRLPKEVKHYYAREAARLPEDDPLGHPKLEAAYQVSRWDGTLRPWTDENAPTDHAAYSDVADDPTLSDFNEEAEETLLAVLADAGVDIRPQDGGEDDGGSAYPYRRDAYFRAEEHDVGRTLVDLDLTRVRSSQESVVIEYLADGFSPVEWEALQTLVTDGGEVSPADIADEHGRHVDSVRRALNRLPELVDTAYGEVKLRSEYIAELVHNAVDEAKGAVQRAVETSAKAIQAAERGVAEADEATSAFIAFCARHGISVDDRRDAQLKLRFGEIEDVQKMVKGAYEKWVNAGRDPMRFRQASLDLGERGKGIAWHWLG